MLLFVQTCLNFFFPFLFRQVFSLILRNSEISTGENSNDVLIITDIIYIYWLSLLYKYTVQSLSFSKKKLPTLIIYHQNNTFDNQHWGMHAYNLIFQHYKEETFLPCITATWGRFQKLQGKSSSLINLTTNQVVYH